MKQTPGSEIDAPSDRPILTTIDHLMMRTHWSRQRVYRLLIAGHLRAVKDGTRTMIIWDTVLDYIATLPPAKFGTPNPAQEGSDV